ncbi:hypothetical protein [Haloplanus halobius]|uniref:hypothetical protein n=1 Tax=Haloplanus halobius TaxID=2934938 RepID=UPI0020103FFF|nr:hypothetical protein [Haloplanus sp. XH21]
MASHPFRGVLCVIVGLLVGGALGPLFVPDPTGVLAAALAFGSALVTSVFLYRSSWFRDR